MTPLPMEKRCLTYPKDLYDPKKWLNFVQLSPFARAWSRMGLSDDDLRAAEIAIMIDPSRPPLVQGTGGVRKLRLAPESWDTGKSGGLRVLYSHWPDYGLVALIYAYSKGEVEDINAEEKKAIKSMIAEIDGYLRSTRSTP